MSKYTLVKSGKKRRVDEVPSDASDSPEKKLKLYHSRRVTMPKQAKSNNRHAMAEDDTSAVQPFRLLDLPAEVRLEIYRACVTRPYNVVLSKAPSPSPWGENDYVDLYNRPRRRSARLRQVSSTAQPASTRATRKTDEDDTHEQSPEAADPLLVNLLATCQLIYREARPVLYGENKFTIRLNTARSTLAALHQRSRGCIHDLHIALPPGAEALERFAELVRLSLRYCWRLQTLTIEMTATGDGTSHANIYTNAFDNLRWLNKDCKIVLAGRVDPEFEKMVELKTALAKTLDENAYAQRQLMSNVSLLGPKFRPLFQ